MGEAPGRDSRPETLGVGKASCSPDEEGVSNDAASGLVDPSGPFEERMSARGKA
jgi:hypothetical protein